MIHLHRRTYPYLEEVNEGVLRQFERLASPTATSPSASRARVLDVGCGQASLGKAVRDLGFEVWGVEESPVAGKIAEARLDRFILGNLTDYAAMRSLIGDARFDFLIFSDVLEHVYDPFTVVLEYRKFLNPNGRIVISVPNCAAWEYRLRLLFGIFRYADTGVMDRTHIRFFTFATAKELIAAAGFGIERVDYTPYVVRALLPLIKRVLVRAPQSGDKGGGDAQAIMNSPLYRFYMRWVYPVEYRVFSLWKALFAFRIIIVGMSEESRL